ncbi:hypothetical protein Tsubulata_030446 [Turnera subulata]|uniref:DUF4283 domain-containing protein n=1 Tax=Turnera subulata TaxID=218843 RepID=A0A9Q0G6Y1_9ROSI|nr:hypothetical protein Tsubulata_030446 [Turnera subulata]
MLSFVFVFLGSSYRVSVIFSVNLRFGGENEVTTPVIESEEEEEVLELEAVAPEQRSQDHWGILARVLGSKHVNLQAFSNLTRKVWNPRKGLEAEQLGRNLFLFHLFNKRDRQEVIDAELPWFFEKRVVVLKKVTENKVQTQVELNKVPIWVQLNNIPWNLRSKSNVTNIALKVGRFLSSDEKGEQGWGRFIRARISVHVEKPIRRSVTIRAEQGTKAEVTFRYEGLPNFYYLYGRMDHLLKKCDQRCEDSDEEECTHYGEWLRASPRKPFRLQKKANDAMAPALKTEVVRKLFAQENAIGVLVAERLDKEQFTSDLDRVLCLDMTRRSGSIID